MMVKMGIRAKILVVMAVMVGAVAWGTPGRAVMAQNLEKPAPAALSAKDKKFIPSPQDRADIAAIEGYLTRLSSFTAYFTQRNHDGSTEQGVFYCLRRPGQSGKMRIDYDKPSTITLISAHGMLIYIDRARDESSYIPLDSSLVGLFAEPAIHFGDKITITNVVRHGNVIDLSLREADNPDFGEAVLYFRRAAEGLTLAAWRIIDGGGNRTDVVLNRIEPTLPDRSDLFEYVPPQMRQKQGGRGG